MLSSPDRCVKKFTEWLVCYFLLRLVSFHFVVLIFLARGVFARGSKPTARSYSSAVFTVLLRVHRVYSRPLLRARGAFVDPLEQLLFVVLCLPVTRLWGADDLFALFVFFAPCRLCTLVAPTLLVLPDSF